MKSDVKNHRVHASIFNDVMGPVMRGPSSSHSAASLRIGRIARDLLGEQPVRVLAEYDPNGSLVTTHTGQGSDMGLAGGIFGWDADDERLPHFRDYAEELGVKFDVSYLSYGAEHPNTYKLTIVGARNKLEILAISTGGGMMEILECDQHQIHIKGCYYEFLFFGRSDEIDLSCLDKENCLVTQKPGVIQISSIKGLSQEILNHLSSEPAVDYVRMCKPVLEVLGESYSELSFTNATEMLQFARKNGVKEIADLAIQYESERGLGSEREVFKTMASRLAVMKAAVARGLAGTEYEDRILPAQTGSFMDAEKRGSLVAGDVLNQVILQVTAMMENKSSMGALVAAPTAGSCGACPGALLGVAEAMQFSEREVVRALLAAGLIGVFIADGATFAAEEAGCMAECGAGSSMAAAGLVSLLGGSVEQALGAASMALQNCLGMICDPVADRVEAPCLGKNVMAATNAVSCANMAMADFAHLIPLDEVIQAMDRVGKLMPSEHCCTGLGGLAMTPTAKNIEEKIAKGNPASFAAKGCSKCSC